MSARDWQPGDRAYIEVEIEVCGPSTTLVAASGSEFVVDTADLLPVPQADEGAIERAAEAIARDLGPLPWDDAAEDQKDRRREQARRWFAAANLLASPVQRDTLDASVSSRHTATPSASPGRSEADGGCGSCVACDPPLGVFLNRMYVCATCGNKRCPASVNCREWECSGSNDPDQPRRRRAARVADTTDTEAGE